MKRFSFILCVIICLLVSSSVNAQFGSLSSNSARSLSRNYTNEFFISGGYNLRFYDFIDAGLRYYHWRNDGQTVLAFSGVSAGCEFSVGGLNNVYIPYAGWQGHLLFLGYGLRAEYAFVKDHQSFGLTPELGVSILEILRITGGYRFSFKKHEDYPLSGFRFSIIAAIPVNFFK